MNYRFLVSDLRTDDERYATYEELKAVIDEMLGQGIDLLDIGIVVEESEVEG